MRVLVKIPGRVAALFWNPIDKVLQKSNMHLFGWQHVSSAGFPTPTSLASATRIPFYRA